LDVIRLNQRRLTAHDLAWQGSHWKVSVDWMDSLEADEWVAEFSSNAELSQSARAQSPAPGPSDCEHAPHPSRGLSKLSDEKCNMIKGAMAGLQLNYQPEWAKFVPEDEWIEAVRQKGNQRKCTST